MKKLLLVLISFFIFSCAKESADQPAPINDDVTIPLSIYEKVYGVTSQIYIQNGYVYINTNGVPDHKSPYFPLDHVLYEAYDGSNPFVNNWNKNPNGITTLNLRFKIPISPKKGSSSTPTSMGPIGVSLNGVPFYNQYACLLYTSPSPRDRTRSRMPSSA